MDDAGGLGTLLAVGVDVAHHVVAHQLFAGDGHIVVDVLHVGFQLCHHFGGDVGQALLHLRAGQRHPQAAPRAELVVVREDVLHLVGGIAGRKRADIAVMLRHWNSSYAPLACAGQLLLHTTSQLRKPEAAIHEWNASPSIQPLSLTSFDSSPSRGALGIAMQPMLLAAAASHTM